MKQKMQHILKISLSVFIAVVIVGTLTSIARADFALESWQYMRSIVISGTTSGFSKVVLPVDISRTAEGFADVRIINADGVEAPYLVTRSISEHGAVTNARIIDTTTSLGGQTRFVADAGQNGLIHTGIALNTTTQNYRRQVKIYASHWPIAIDGSEWALVTDKAYIFKFTDPESGSVSGKNEINFAPSSARYIKVVIEAGSGADNSGSVAVSSATLYGDSHVDVPVSLNDIPVSVFNNPKKRTTEITADLGAKGHLTSAITITTADTNYSRRVIVEASDTNTASSTWRYVGAGSISSVSTTLFTGTSNRVTYPEQKSRFIRLSIVNDDNRPLSISGQNGGQTVAVESPVISVVFETRPGETYHLYYGNPKARVPSYDIAHISSYIQENSIPSAFLGEELENPEYVAPAGPVVPFTEGHKYLLNTLLVVVVVLLLGVVGWYLRTYMKTNDQNSTR